MKPASQSASSSGAIALGTLETELRREDGYTRDGHTARTLLRAPDLRVVYVVIRGGAAMAPHRIEEAGSLHVVSGQLRVRFADRTVELAAGQLLVIEAGAAHDVEAAVDSAFVLTLGWRGKA